MFDDFFGNARELQMADTPFVSVVVVRAETPTSGKPGDRAIVTADGEMLGWVGGSCAQPTVIEQAARALAERTPRLIRLSPNPGSAPVPPGIEEVPMTCFSGGTLDIFIEPHFPRPHLLVVGTLPVARSLAHLGRAMSYRITLVDPLGSDVPIPADRVLTDLGEIQAHVTPLTFCVVATHGEYDEPALTAILKTDAPYVGLVASRSRGTAVLEHLRREGVDEDDLQRVRFPAGLDIGARRGDEIALAIFAEIVQVGRGLGEISWTPESGVEAAEAAGDADAGATAVDPICGMTVQIEGALHTFEHEGATYYFCCDGCRSRFAESPEVHLATQ